MKSQYFVALAAVVAYAVVPPAQAELGGAPTWPAAVPQGMQQARDLAAGAAPYTMIETTLPSSTVVREYVSQAGTVFGIAWSGPEMAPLNTLLGAYFPTYIQALNARRAAQGGGLGPAVIQEAGLVVQTGGHMGAFTGQAYLQDGIPQGVNASDIR